MGETSMMGAILSVSAFMITMLLAIIGFFISRVLIKIDDTSKILNNFNARIEVIAKSIEVIEKNYIKVSEESYLNQTAVREEIEMLRCRTHQMVGWLTTLRLKMEAKGEKFSSSEWSLAPLVADSYK